MPEGDNPLFRIPTVVGPIGGVAQAGPAPSGSNPYATVVAGDGPIAWWRLNETSGTSAADSGQAPPANGTYTGTVVLGKKGIAYGDGPTNLCVDFAGAGYVDVGAIPSKLQFASGAPFSLEAWCYLRTNDTIGIAMITEGFADDSKIRYYLRFPNDLTYRPMFGWYDGSDRAVTASTAMQRDMWHHCVGTFDGTTQRLYIDGSFVGQNTTLGTQPGGTGNLYVGRRWDTSGNNNWGGYLDEVAIYNYALSGAQIAAHYNAKSPLAYTDLIVTHTWAEVAIYGPTPETRVTHVWAEVAAEEFLHFFGWPEEGDDSMVYSDDTYGIGDQDAGFVRSGAASYRSKGRSKASGGIVDTSKNYRKNVQYRNNSQYRG